MDSNIKLSGQDAGWTVYALIEMCRERVLQIPQAARPVTVAAVAFYVLEWACREGVAVSGENPLVDDQGDELPRAQVAQRIEVVIENLEKWGAAVSALQAGGDKEWELVRIQMEKSLQSFYCPREDKEDVMQDALGKLFFALKRLPTIAELELGSAVEASRITALMEKHSKNLGSLYNFSNSLYAYAKGIAPKTMISFLLQRKRELLDVIDGDVGDVVEGIRGESGPEETMIDRGEQDSWRELLRIGLTRLLALISGKLSAKYQKVLLLSLSARPAFWRALAYSEVAAPPGLTPLPSGTTDAQIGQQLDITDINVRTSRNYAKKQICEWDALAGQVLEELLRKTKGQE